MDVRPVPRKGAGAAAGREDNAGRQLKQETRQRPPEGQADAADGQYGKLVNWFKTGKLVAEGESGGSAEEGAGYGSPRLRHEVYGGRLETVKDLVEAFVKIQAKSKGRPMLFVVSQGDGGKKMFQLNSCEVEDGQLVFQLAASELPDPMPVSYVVQGIAQELKKPDDAMKFQFVCDGQAKDIKELALDVMRFPESPDVFYFLNVQLKDSGRKAPAQKAAEAAEAPQTVGEFIAACEQIRAQSGRSGLLDKPAVFEIPSVPDRSVAAEIDDIPDEFRRSLGQLCVVDYASPAKAHAKIELMGFDRFKELDRILNGGEFSVKSLLDSFGKFEKNLALFFMYRGRPYEIDEMKAEPGRPLWITLAPWGSVNESRKPLGEIEAWAACCENQILDWTR